MQLHPKRSSCMKFIKNHSIMKISTVKMAKVHFIIRRLFFHRKTMNSQKTRKAFIHKMISYLISIYIVLYVSRRK